jgi:hypothetical protein
MASGIDRSAGCKAIASAAGAGCASASIDRRGLRLASETNLAKRVKVSFLPGSASTRNGGRWFYDRNGSCEDSGRRHSGLNRKQWESCANSPEFSQIRYRLVQ